MAWTGRRRPAQVVPRRGGCAGHLEMEHSLISTSLLKIISSRYAENAKRPGKPPVPDVQAHFHRYEARSNCWTSRAPRWRVVPSSSEAPATVSRLVEPTLPFAPPAASTIPSGVSEDAPFEPSPLGGRDVSEDPVGPPACPAREPLRPGNGNGCRDRFGHQPYRMPCPEADQEKRKRLVSEIDRRLQEDQARPIVYHLRFATCWQPLGCP